MSVHQPLCQSSRPTTNSARDLFIFCVKQAMERDLWSDSNTHFQWAQMIFGYEKNSSMRIDYMSIVKREYSTYFSRENKYSFLKDKIERDFPSLIGEDDDDEDDYTSDGLIRKTIKILGKEIVEQKDPKNIESFKGSDLSLVKHQGESYIYQVKLLLSDGQEPHFHDGIPFILYAFSKAITCEAVDFDYESGVLYFTAHRFLSPAPYYRVLLDSTFILEGLRHRLEDLKEKRIDEDLPFAKFIFEETEQLTKVEHKAVPSNLTENLDRPQRSAFYAALDKDITFIWGPPGTGKSFTLASIIYALYELGEDRTAICCLSNVAVDQLLCKVLDIINTKKEKIEPGNIYRAGRTSDSRIISTAYLFPNDQRTQNLRNQIKCNLDRLLWLKEHKSGMSEESIILKAENKDLREQLKEHTESLVKSSRLVFSTISNFILSNNLYESKFENLIVDEASMLSMPSLLALGNKISKRLILVGDFQQLSPIALIQKEELKNSVFEMAGIDIKNTEHPALYQLLNQRRSNERIVNIINDTFYNNKLTAIIKEESEVINSDPYKGRVIALRKVTNGAVRFTRGGTRQNKAFAESIIQLLDKFQEDKSAQYSIGVITPYKGQVALLKALKYERKYPEAFEKRIKIGTIHTFQGSECDVIIYDMVDCAKSESGKPSKIGKIYSGTEGERLLNVAISRARHKLIVVCDIDFICNIPGNTLSDNARKVFEKLSRYRFSS